MEIEIANKIEELDLNELIEVLMKFKMEDMEAFLIFKEIIEDL